MRRAYTNFPEYVRDAALISHNAQTYNRPEAGAYHDAILLRELFQDEFQKLVKDSVITAEASRYPDLGELPPVEDLPPPADAEEEEEDEEEDEDDEDEEDEEDDSEEDSGKRKRKRGPRSTAAITKREAGTKADKGAKGDDLRKRRGRPPKVDTPMEARIKNVLKAMRKCKNDKGHVMFHSFERLPDKAELPDYYMEIKEPLAIEQIKRKAKRKKYHSVDHFLRDMDTMFNNCKSYNMEDSQVYQDAVTLQTETRKLVNEEKAKPDAEFALEEGRLPLPDGVTHDGELWKIGDWIHLQNANDVTKPIVAQIYRTWQDTEGDKWINACWYYRPEQTVHQHEKHFFPHEVVKTGQYRDHRVDEILDRCFVMFTTRYSRGRPRGLDADRDVYVCESRYNEEKQRMNKIKTWASCLPDEVRDKDYEMDLFDNVKKVKKVPSPILHLLKPDADESEVKPRWGVDNAPPIVGAVYQGTRDENVSFVNHLGVSSGVYLLQAQQSPPPEPTPSPSPQPSPQPAKPIPNMASSYNTPDSRRSDPRLPTGNASLVNHAANYASSHLPPHQQHTTATAPLQHPHRLAQHTSATCTQPADHYGTPTSRYSQPQRASATDAAASRPDEVFRLPENANMAIPADVRNQFQQDDQGHVLFFTAPPLDTLPPTKPGSAVGHTARYLAAKLQAPLATREKRNLTSELPYSDSIQPKRLKTEVATPNSTERIKAMTDDALKIWTKQLQDGTDVIYQELYGQHWEEGKAFEAQLLRNTQIEAGQEQKDLETSRKRRRERSRVSLARPTVFKDDSDPRY